MGTGTQWMFGLDTWNFNMQYLNESDAVSFSFSSLIVKRFVFAATNVLIPMALRWRSDVEKFSTRDFGSCTSFIICGTVNIVYKDFVRNLPKFVC